MEIKGKVIAVLPKVSGVGSNGPWARQTVVVEFFEGEYPTKLALENSNKAEEFGRLHVGDEISAKFSVSSREYQGKWYTSTRCYSWSIVSAASEEVAPAHAETAPTNTNVATATSEGSDDLPF